MKILLAAINAKYIHSNLAVYCLRAYAGEHLAEEGAEEIRIAQYMINQPVESIIQDLYLQKPQILCFSCYIWNIRFVEECRELFARNIRQNYK